MKFFALILAVVLLCGSAHGQCVDGKCPVRATAKAAVKAVDNSVAKTEKLVSVLVHKSQHNLKAVCVKAKECRPVRKLRGKLKSR